MNILDTMTDKFELMFFKKHIHHHCIYDQQTLEDKKAIHQHLRDEISGMQASLDNEEMWFLTRRKKGDSDDKQHVD